MINRAKTPKQVGVLAASIFGLLSCQRSSQDGSTSSHVFLETLDAGGSSGLAITRDPPEREGGPSVYELCDGTSEVRLAAASMVSHGDYEVARAWALQYDWYVVVTGECEVWARTGLQPWRATLSSAEALQLTADLRLGEWDAGWRSGGSHETVSLLADAEGRSFACALSGCNGGAGDSVVAAALSLAERVVEDADTSSASGIVTVYASAQGDAGSALQAPPTLAGILDAHPDGGQVSLREVAVTEPAALAWLREQRDAFVTTQLGVSNKNYLVVSTEAGTVYEIAYRDVMPFEDTAGELPALYP